MVLANIMRSLFAVTVSLIFIFPVYSRDCFNNRKFSFRYAGQYRNCQNIRIDEFRREEMCSRFPEVFENCPQTCGRCCVDMPDYTFRPRRKRPDIEETCDYVANNPVLQARHCKKWSLGMMVRDACPLSCDFCQPAVLQLPPTPPPMTPPPTYKPTKPPTPSPTVAPTKSPTAAPTKPPTPNPTTRPTNTPRTGRPTPSPTVSPTKSPTKTPTKPPTVSPTGATPSPSLGVCEDDLTYYANNRPKLSCLTIGEDEDLRARWCQDSMTVNACPRTCGVCCKDDKKYIFTTNLGTKKKCAWMKGEKIRQRRYCEKIRDGGKLVKLACPKTCGFCFKP